MIPIIAIKNPPVAWPVTEAESQVPWLHVVAFCKSSPRNNISNHSAENRPGKGSYNTRAKNNNVNTNCNPMIAKMMFEYKFAGNKNQEQWQPVNKK